MSMLHLLAALMPKTKLDLLQKGYGSHSTASGVDFFMNYSTVASGSGPAAGDIVVWSVWEDDFFGTAVQDLTSLGWVQQTQTGSQRAATLLAKVVTAGDLSSLAKILNTDTSGNIGFWVAYSVVAGSVLSLSIPALNYQYGGASAPTNQTVDSSALDPPSAAITVAHGGGDDNSPSTAMSGATADITFTSANNVWGGGTAESRVLVNLTVGGANITISKGDDGGVNHLSSGYVAVS